MVVTFFFSASPLVMQNNATLPWSNFLGSEFHHCGMLELKHSYLQQGHLWKKYEKCILWAKRKFKHGWSLQFLKYSASKKKVVTLVMLNK